MIEINAWLLIIINVTIISEQFVREVRAGLNGSSQEVVKKQMLVLEELLSNGERPIQNGSTTIVCCNSSHYCLSISHSVGGRCIQSCCRCLPSCQKMYIPNQTNC